MDIEKFMGAMADADRDTRSNYHLTYGELIDALTSAHENALFDERIVGLSAYRGYYSDIALDTESNGYTCQDEDYPAGAGLDYHEFRTESIPRKAHELAELLKSLIGKGFNGYKGGFNIITIDKPLWVATDYGDCSDVAVVGIDASLNLITKIIE